MSIQALVVPRTNNDPPEPATIEISPQLVSMVRAIILAERERCAKIAEEYWYGEGFDRQGLIYAIRKGE
jgi:hypothetical protein